MSKKVIICVSKLATNYEKWLKNLDNNLEIIDLYPLSLSESKQQLLNCSGILLPGGSDINSTYYNRAEDLKYCKNVDENRDLLEIEILRIAFMRKIPVLGICRGMQMINVARKGSLYPDIPTFLKCSITHADKEDVYHPVIIKRQSRLYDITEKEEGTVNSAHHQAIRDIGNDLIITSNSPDDIIESIELNGSEGHSYCIAVQWHPERMDISNPFSGKLGLSFIEESRKFS